MSKEKNIEEYLSEVRHDLRSELLVVHEGINQVLDGLGNKECGKCFNILKIALESTDALNKKILNLLDSSKFKATGTVEKSVRNKEVHTVGKEISKLIISDYGLKKEKKKNSTIIN